MFFEAQGASLCGAVCLRRGAAKELVGHPLPQHVYLSGGSLSLEQWLEPSCLALEVGFVNQGEEVADIFWVSFDGQRSKLEGALTRGLKLDASTNWVKSYMSHDFVAVRREAAQDLVEVFTDADSVHVVGTAPPAVRAEDSFLSHVPDIVEMTVINEWKRARKVARTFTGLGFKKDKLPLDLWNSISSYHYNNRNSSMREEWGLKGVFVNWWEADPYFIPAPPTLGTYW